MKFFIYPHQNTEDWQRRNRVYFRGSWPSQFSFVASYHFYLFRRWCPHV